MYQFPYSESGTLYAVVRNAVGRVWNGSGWEAYNAGHWASYSVAAAAAGGGVYEMDLTPIGAGNFTLVCYFQDGDSPATSDPAVWEDSVAITGAVVRPPSTGRRGSLQDQIARDAANLILNGSSRMAGFSELVTYAAAGGTPRTIEVVAERDQQTPADPLGDEERMERIKVFCLRDPVLGISNPQLQDTLLRTGEPRAYVFSGEIVNENQATFTLIFHRPLRTGRGVRG